MKSIQFEKYWAFLMKKHKQKIAIIVGTHPEIIKMFS